MWTYRATCKRVIDGDTLELLIDAGFDITVTKRIRLKGVWAPERGTPEATDASALLMGWITDPSRQGEWPLRVVTDRTRNGAREVTTLARYVGVVTDTEGGCLNTHLAGELHRRGLTGGIGAPRQG